MEEAPKMKKTRQRKVNRRSVFEDIVEVSTYFK